MKRKFMSAGAALLIILVTVMGTSPKVGNGSANPPILEQP